MTETICIIAQRCPEPAYRGDQLAVSKLIKYANKMGIKIKLVIPFWEKSKVNKSELLSENDLIECKFLWPNIFVFLTNMLNKRMPLQMRLFSIFRYNIETEKNIYVHTIRMAIVPRGYLCRQIICPQIDLAVEYRERSEHEKNYIKRYLFQKEYKSIIAWQSENLSKYKFVHCINTDEFEEYEIPRIASFPHGYDVSKTCLKPFAPSSKLVIGFWGNGSFKPNLNALVKLMKWSDSSNLDHEIRVYGVNWDFLETRNCSYKGPFNNLAEFLPEVDLLINLVNEGAGFQNKTIEALAWSIPVIGFPEGFRGLNLPDSLKYLVNSIDEIDATILSIRADLNGKIFDSVKWIENNWDQEKLAIKKIESIIQ